VRASLPDRALFEKGSGAGEMKHPQFLTYLADMNGTRE